MALWVDQVPGGSCLEPLGSGNQMSAGAEAT
jgi:hypothetical protein